MDIFDGLCIGDLVILEDADGGEYEAIVKMNDEDGLYFEPITREQPNDDY